MADAFTQLADIFEPSTYLSYEKEFEPEKFDLMASSAVSTPPMEVMSQLSAGGSVIDMPFWQDVDRTEPNAMTDTVGKADSKKMTAGRSKAHKFYWAKDWAATRFAGAIATGNPDDPMQAIAGFTLNYWRRIYQKTAVRALDGVLADNVANDSGDMRFSVYSDIATPLAANLISPTAVNNARNTAGEFMDETGIMVMNPKVYTDALNQEDIDFVQHSKLPFKIAMYAGLEVVVSQDATTVAGTNSPLYRTYILGPGAISVGTHLPPKAAVVDEEPREGQGAGIDYLVNRRHAIIHPKGFSYTGTPAVAKTPSWTEYSAAANWDRTHKRDNIPISYLETN